MQKKKKSDVDIWSNYHNCHGTSS